PRSSTRRQIPAGAAFAAEGGARTREDMTMNTTITMHSIAIAIAGVVTIGIAGPTWAASVPPSTAAVATAAPNAATDVRYYRNGYRRGYRNYGGVIAGGLALGVIGALAGQAYYGDRAYD